MVLRAWLKAYQTLDLRRRGRWMLVASILLGTLAGWAVTEQMDQLRRVHGTTVEVLVASRPITAQTVVTKEMLTSRAVPQRYVMKGMIAETERNQVVGSSVLISLPKDALLTADMLRSPTAQDSSTRPYMLSTSRQVVFWGLKQGDLVDVMAIYEADNDGKTALIAEAVPVLSAWEENRVGYISLAVSPNQAQMLAYFENFGKQLRILRRG